MAIAIAITYKIDQSSKMPESYSLRIGETGAETHGLRSVPPTVNNIATTKGVFFKMSDAIQAVLGYVEANCQIVEFTNALTDESTVTILPLGKFKVELGSYANILGNKSPRGIWVAA